jgi:hypothetical protein
LRGVGTYRKQGEPGNRAASLIHDMQTHHLSVVPATARCELIADACRSESLRYTYSSGFDTAIRACGLAGDSVVKRREENQLLKGTGFLPKSSSRFTLNFRDVDDLLAERGITFSYAIVRRRVDHFGHDRSGGVQTPTKSI